jgi:hypothetical protein
MLSLFLLLAALPDAGSEVPRAPFQWDVPEMDRMVEVGDRLEARGLPLKVYLVHTRWKQAEIFKHYYQRFVKEGLFVDPKQKPLPGLDLLRLTAFDEARKWSYTIIFYPERDGSTTLTLGAADMHVRQTAQAAANGEGLPVLPGATGVLTTNVELGRSLSFTTKDSADEVLSFYQSTLPTIGWKEREKGVFIQKGRRVRVLTREESGALQVVLLEDIDLEQLR